MESAYQIQPILRVEPMDRENLNSVLDIERRVFPQPWTREMFLNEIYEKPFSHTCVLKTDSSLDAIGYTCFWVLAQELQLLTLAIAPAFQGQGYGNEFLRWILSVGKNKEVSKTFLEVRTSNQSAIRLYEKNGFHCISRRKNYYSNPQEDALIFHYSTNPSFI